MDERTLTALQGSIAKWQAIVDGTGGDEGPDNCPLCIEFQDIWDEYGFCSGCPVRDDITDRQLCGNSPYDKWALIRRGPQPWFAKTKSQVAAARDELAFLQSLLP